MKVSIPYTILYASLLVAAKLAGVDASKLRFLRANQDADRQLQVTTDPWIYAALWSIQLMCGVLHQFDLRS